MGRDGAFFISIAEPGRVTRSVWDPVFYRRNGGGKVLGDYVAVARLRRKGATHRSPLRAIEYADISRGKALAFELELSGYTDSNKCEAGEQELLMGTMRAYLGNVIVTPKAEWLGLESPLIFPVKSEFVQVIPRDGCLYFWWAFIRSQAFLSGLPAGSGGTRPRLQPGALMLAPARAPALSTRRAIHEQLIECAETEWRQAARRVAMLKRFEL
jgi:hypothetical protein